MVALIGTSTARKIIIKSNPDRNADLFEDKDFTFSQDKDDNKEPTIFKGDPMKTKTVISENVQGKKNFKFAYVYRLLSLDYSRKNLIMIILDWVHRTALKSNRSDD